MTINDFPLSQRGAAPGLYRRELRSTAGVINAGSAISRSMSCGQAPLRNRGCVKSRSLRTGLSPFPICCPPPLQTSQERD